MHTRTHLRRGYVLVVTLGLLVLAATLLVSIGRAALDHALLARRQQAELQQRWGVLSARLAILPGADNALARLEQDLHRPLPVFRTSVRLGDQTFEIVLGDEQAKANVNALLATVGQASAETRIRDALSGTGLTSAVQLHPVALEPNRSGALPRRIEGFGQVLDNITPDRLLNAPGAAPIETITCWGDGAVNITRASRTSLVLAAVGYVNELAIGRLIKARDAAFAPIVVARSTLLPRTDDREPVSNSADAVTRLLAGARIDRSIRNQVAFTSRSTCHSLWVVAHSAQSARYFLFVADESDLADRQIRAFAW